MMMRKTSGRGRHRSVAQFSAQPMLRGLWLSAVMVAVMFLGYAGARFVVYLLGAEIIPLDLGRAVRGIGFAGTSMFAYVLIVGSINRRRCANLVDKLDLDIVPPPNFGFAKHLDSNSSVMHLADAIDGWLRTSSFSFVRNGQRSWRVYLFGLSIWDLALTSVADGQVRVIVTHRFSFWAKTFDANFGVQGADLLLSMMLLMLRDGQGSEEMRREVEHVSLDTSFARAFGLPDGGRSV